MYRTFLLGAGVALSLGVAAHAQSNAAPPPAALPAAPPSDAVNPPAGPAFKQGMVVKDTSGATVGTIAQIGKTPDGQPAVVVNVDGKQVGMLASNLTLDPTGEAAVSTFTKAQLQAPAAPANPG